MYQNPKMRLSAEQAQSAQQALYRTVDSFLSSESIPKNVTGLGVGVKWTQGKPTGEPALIVLVRTKQSKKDLSPQDIVPQHLEGIPTDVVSVGELQALQIGSKSLTERTRPLIGGYSVSRLEGGGTGTIGACVHDIVEEEEGQPSSPNFYILSNNHVLANSNEGKPGDLIIQPGLVDGGTEDDVVARLTRFVSLDFEPPTPRQDHRNFVDAAIAQGDLTALEREIHWIGRPNGWRQIFGDDVGTFVQKCGRSSGYNVGRIVAINTAVDVNFGQGRTARFREQIITTPISSPGDSGSLVTDLENKALGLLFAGSDQATIINPISLVRALLGVELGIAPEEEI